MKAAGARRARTAGITSSDLLRLPHTASSVGVARRQIRHDLAAQGLHRELLDDVEVVVSELLGNAVRHARALAGGALLVGWHSDGREIEVEVTDGGSPGRVQPRGVALLEESGRGLRIVDGLAAQWGVTDHRDGSRTVWALITPDGSVDPSSERSDRSSGWSGHEPAHGRGLHPRV